MITEPDSVEKLNICKSIVYVLNSENLSFSEAKDLAEAVTERLIEKVKNIRIVNTFYDTECESPDCALEDVKNTGASHVFILSTEIDRLTTESVITFRNIAYDRDSDEFQPDSEKDLNLLLDLLEDYPKMTIDLKVATIQDLFGKSKCVKACPDTEGADYDCKQGDCGKTEFATTSLANYCVPKKLDDIKGDTKDAIKMLREVLHADIVE